jgi:hypothetical protein
MNQSAFLNTENLPISTYQLQTGNKYYLAPSISIYPIVSIKLEENII